MYKLFLCLRYLRRRYLALIAVASVALCVAMVLIVVSVFDGFLRKVELAARGLFGDVVMEAGLAGIAEYDEFIEQLRREVPEVQAATPVIWSFGLIRIGDSYTDTVSVCGMRLPERLAVTNFGEGLFVQAGRADASFDPPLERVIRATEANAEAARQARQAELARPPERRDPERLERLDTALFNAPRMLAVLENALLRRQVAERLRLDLAAEQAKPPDVRDGQRIADLTDRIDELVNELPHIRGLLAEAQSALALEEAKDPEQRDPRRVAALTADVEDLSGRMERLFRPPSERIILGLGMAGLSFRTPEGQTVRLVTPGRNAVLSLLPVGRGLGGAITPNTRTLTVIDDARTDVYTIDSKTVYVPFETLQQLTDMDRRTDAATGRTLPARCSQVQIKVRPEHASDRRLVEIRREVEAAWRRFVQEHPQAMQSAVVVHTWRERLAKYIGPIEKQRTLVTLMFGIISLVSVLLIFAIFYMIVAQKTRDIGIIRAVGGSSGGVAQVFLAFGAATGLVGSAIGLAVGWLFVHYINQIHDWLGAWAGFTVFDPEVFMFARIPNQVELPVAVVIALWAVAAGLVGALIPGVRAGVMEPVEAIRYE